jgi:iron complex outermembrane receptor protein
MKQLSWKQTLAIGGLTFAILGSQIRLAEAQGPTPATDDLSALSLEQLVRMEVSSVARRDQLLSKTPAAVFVITQEDIRRSGASNIPELLRIVPGIQVAQVEANKWAVSARGFNGIFADKMLVMIDSRTVYTAIYSGVFWDENEVPLEDIERVEVIRGPGATMWGANAVNGVINIITKKAKDTIGAFAVLTAGSMDRSATARYGGQAGNSLQFRAFLQDLRRSPLVDGNDASTHDGGDALRGGGRIDWQPTKRDWLTLHGDVFRGREDQNVQVSSDTESGYSQTVVQDKAQNSGGYALARWEHRMEGADFALQAYYNEENRKENKGYGREGTIDIDFQHHIPIDALNDVTWGLGFRRNQDHVRGQNMPFAHATHETLLISSFVQDELSLLPNKIVLTVGSKFQWNSYTHLEVQPNLRLILMPDEHHSIWASVSRAVRTPSVRDEDLLAYFPTPSASPIPTEVLVKGNPAIKSEADLAYEAGYREQFGKHLSADITGFYSRYFSLVSQVQLTPYVTQSMNPVWIVPVI